MENTEKLVVDFFNKIKSDRTAIIGLKNLAVRNKELELAEQLRELENLIPQPEGYAEAQMLAQKLELSFRMCGIGIPPKAAWIVYEASKIYSTIGGEFSIKDASEIIVKADEYFKEYSIPE